ncbi:MAG: hypothetical protein ACFB21_09995 [Opitutales bacterium]
MRFLPFIIALVISLVLTIIFPGFFLFLLLPFAVLPFSFGKRGKG